MGLRVSGKRALIRITPEGGTAFDASGVSAGGRARANAFSFEIGAQIADANAYNQAYTEAVPIGQNAASGSLTVFYNAQNGEANAFFETMRQAQHEPGECTDALKYTMEIMPEGECEGKEKWTLEDMVLTSLEFVTPHDNLMVIHASWRAWSVERELVSVAGYAYVGYNSLYWSRTQEGNYVYEQSRVWFSTNRSGTWEKVLVDTLDNGYCTPVCVANDGDHFILTTDFRNTMENEWYELVYESFDGGATWVDVGDEAGDFSGFLYCINGTWVTFTYQGLMKYSMDACRTWTTTTAPHEGAANLHNTNSVYIDATGTIHMVWWESGGNSSDMWYGKTSDFGSTWAVKNLGYAGDWMLYPFVVGSGEHVAVVAYSESENDDIPGICYAFSHDNGTTFTAAAFTGIPIAEWDGDRDSAGLLIINGSLYFVVGCGWDDQSPAYAYATFRGCCDDWKTATATWNWINISPAGFGGAEYGVGGSNAYGAYCYVQAFTYAVDEFYQWLYVNDIRVVDPTQVDTYDTLADFEPNTLGYLHPFFYSGSIEMVHHDCFGIGFSR